MQQDSENENEIQGTRQGLSPRNMQQGTFFGQYDFDNKFYADLMQEKTNLIRKLAEEKNKGIRISYDLSLMQDVIKLCDKMYTLSGNYDILDRIKISYDGTIIYYSDFMKELVMNNKLQVMQTITKVTLFADLFFQLLAIHASMRKSKRTIMPWEKELKKAQEKARAKKEAEENTKLALPVGFNYDSTSIQWG